MRGMAKFKSQDDRNILKDTPQVRTCVYICRNERLVYWVLL